jgi:hypothetical protein
MTTVAENAHIAGTPIRARLKAIEKTISPHRPERNRVVHQATYSDEELRTWGMFAELQKSAVESDQFISTWRHFYKAKADNYVKSKRQDLSTTMSVVFETVAQLLQSLLPIVQRTYRTFSEPSKL